VRNVVASPLSGCDSRGRLDVHPLVGELDRGLCADPGLAALPGRFLFTVDDGRGDVIGLDGDVGLLATGPDRFALLLAGIRTGVEVPRESAVRTALACAAAFLEERERQGSGAWRLAELPDGVAAVLDRLGADDLEVEAGVATSVATAGSNGNLAAGSSASGPGLRVGYGIQPDASSDVDALPARMQPVGIVEGASGQASLVVGAPLGRLSRDQGRAVAALAHDTTGWARITPWRSVVVPVTTAGDKAAPPGPALRGRSGGGRQWAAERLEMLAGLGMVTDPSSPLLGVTACTGWPGCASGLADVQADARRVVSMAAPGGLPVHWVGCGHRCGRPAGRAVEVLATADGYQVSAGDHPLGTFGTAEAAGAAADEARQT
jgi:precorrin-3B synthase